MAFAAVSAPWLSPKAAAGWLLLLGLITRFAVLAHSPAAAMDEIYFSQYLSAYFTHRYYFDIHPPLGKLLVAGFVALFDFVPVPLATKFDASFVGNNALLLRFLPCLAGALLPPLLFAVARALGLSVRASFLAGLFVVLDNSLIAHSQFLYFDNFLLLFGFAALWLMLRSGLTPNLMYVLGAGVLAGLAASVKWTGLTFLGIAGALVLWRTGYQQRAWTRAVITVALLGGFAIAIYALVFWIHFALLPLSGPGDGFMSLNFQQTLIGNPQYQSHAVRPAFLQTLFEIHKEMWAVNQRVVGGHPYGSSWWQWPLLWKPIYYLLDNHHAAATSDSNTYSIGNFILWWSASAAVLVAIGAAISAWSSRRVLPMSLLFLLAAYLLSWLPFAAIGRVMFLYHYYCAYLFALILLALVLERFAPRRLIVIFCGLALGMFIYLAPLTYGLPIDIHFYEYAWLPAWR